MMKIINNIIKLIDNFINHIVIIVLIVLLLFSGYALYDVYATYQKAEISGEILQYRPDDNEMLLLDNLQKEINKDICGWIRIDNTNIDYPIVIGEDNTEYLNYDYKKEYSITGSIFVDYRNNREFKDDYTIIYGHNLKTDLMFAEIKRYAEKDYFDSHLTGTLYTGDKIYKIQIKYFESIEAYSKVYSLNVYKNKNNKELLKEFEKKAICKSIDEISSKDKLLLLSTCNVGDNETRSVLIARLQEKDESDIINKDKDITLKQIDKQLSDKEKAESAGELEKKDLKTIIKNRARIIIFIIIVIIVLIILYLIIKRKKQKEIDDEKDSKNDKK